MNKVYIWILNCHLEINFKIQGFWFGFSLWYRNIFTDFPKKGGGGQKRTKMASQHPIFQKKKDSVVRAEKNPKLGINDEKKQTNLPGRRSEGLSTHAVKGLSFLTTFSDSFL